ncbi:MAG: helix-turn-helix domain-containing protein [Treponema sp.]|nr:helix-turn-helix domain-containing protein [Treponema sp.]
MRLINQYSEFGCRPYPFDRERRKRVLIVLAERDMNISDLARNINTAQSTVSQVINGRRLSPNTEQRIADFLRKPVDVLFPRRTPEEIGKMRKKEASLCALIKQRARKGEAA